MNIYIKWNYKFADDLTTRDDETVLFSFKFFFVLFCSQFVDREYFIVEFVDCLQPYTDALHASSVPILHTLRASCLFFAHSNNFKKLKRIEGYFVSFLFSYSTLFTLFSLERRLCFFSSCFFVVYIQFRIIVIVIPQLVRRVLLLSALSK